MRGFRFEDLRLGGFLMDRSFSYASWPRRKAVIVAPTAPATIPMSEMSESGNVKPPKIHNVKNYH